MRELQPRLAELRRRALARAGARRELRPEPGPGATRTQVDAYQKHLGFDLPADYRAFLRMHRGFKNLAESVHFIDPLELMRATGLARRVKAFLEEKQLIGQAAVIGRREGLRTFIYLVRWSPERVEYVEEWPRIETVHSSLVALLDSYLGASPKPPVIPPGPARPPP